MSGITKGERAELRSVVKQQFKVLREEVTQRQAELLADAEEEIAGRYATDDQSWAAFQHAVHEVTMEANRRVNDLLHEHGYEEHGPTERLWFSSPNMSKPEGKKNELRRLAHSKITEQVRAAVLTLNRQEADLLRTLSVGALESTEAHAFLSAIPTVGELVPAARLAELEAAITIDGEDDA